MTEDKAPHAKSAAQPRRSPRRVRIAHVDWVDARLSNRDRAIMASVYRLRVATGPQLERLHFAELNETSRARNRRLVLRRLSDWRVLAPLPRRVGGSGRESYRDSDRGSDPLTFALDSAGQLLVHHTPVRRPYIPTTANLKHSLAVSEFYVQLIEASRTAGFELLTFAKEPACWWPDGLGRWVKDDAFFRLATPDHIDSWWLEQDMHRTDKHSEDLPTIKEKCLTYLDFVARGQVGPHGVVPRVLIRVQEDKRKVSIERMIALLPAPAAQLFYVATEDEAVSYVLRVLRA